MGTTGKQKITNRMRLAQWCIMNHNQSPSGTILHEFIHAWGFSHEHNRPDRDKYVKVKKNEGNYERKDGLRWKTFDVPYDGGSIMHYPLSSAMKSLMDFKGKIGQRKMMSECDVLRLKNMYNCQVSKCKDYYKEPECKMYKEKGKCINDTRIKKMCKKTC